ncbi:uncharacterized protein LOC123866739 [Maniola jurtina]|uniref:uncharacterized protein LOC123866739 n=1 Tax=Maniola jurtina TaxID=191418 RepID=UPI001E685F66|nr:uncharacterized protein LOC123866739 [Maniola jurtina]
MVKCSACGRFLSPTGAATCTLCPGLYHRACVGIPETGRSPKQWKCPECIAKKPKVGNVNTPVKGAEPSNTESEGSPAEKSEIVEKDIISESALDTSQSSDLSLELRLFREEIRQLRTEIQDFCAELCDVRGAIAVCNQRMDEFDSRLINLEKEVKVSSSRCAEVDKLEETVAQLREDLNARDQDLLQGDIEITNLPEVNGENPHHTIMVVAAKLGVDLDEKDIIFAERVGKKNDSSSQMEGGTRGRRVVVRLARPNLRESFLRSARTRRGITTEGLGFDLPARRFYVNERLTKKNKQLFYLVRETAKRLQWRYTWTKRGKIYARQGEGKPAHQIKSETDVDRVFGEVQVG